MNETISAWFALNSPCLIRRSQFYLGPFNKQTLVDTKFNNTALAGVQSKWAHLFFLHSAFLFPFRINWTHLRNVYSNFIHMSKCTIHIYIYLGKQRILEKRYVVQINTKNKMTRLSYCIRLRSEVHTVCLDAQQTIFVSSTCLLSSSWQRNHQRNKKVLSLENF